MKRVNAMKLNLHLSEGMREENANLPMIEIFDSVAGTLVSATAAAGITAVAVGRPWRISVPLVFLAVLFFVSFLFGSQAGILSTLSATVIFGVFLLHPEMNEHARDNLGWMFLLGMFFSFLFAPRRAAFRHR